jgi:ADP-heptose:LPS heptosyltransferase
MKSILIVSVTGMGDSLWATPAIRALKKTFPDVSIDFLTKTPWVPLFKNNPYLNRVFDYQEKWYRQWKTIWELRKYYFNRVLIFHANKGFFRVQKYINFDEIWSSQNFLWIQDDRRIVLDGPVHGIQKRLRLVQEIGVRPDGKQMDLILGDEAKNESGFFFEKSGLESKRYIYVNVGASSETRRWPVERFSRIIERILDETSFSVVVGAGPTEGDWVEFLVRRFNTKRVLCSRHLSLVADANVIGQSRLTITSDTGPMHLAFAQRIPTVALFGSTHPDYSGPPNQKDENCFLILSPGFKAHLPPSQNEKLNSFLEITEEMVWLRIREALDYAEKI